MHKKIFNDQGFLTPEGKIFLNDNFTKEVKKVMSTAQSRSDALIISSILKSIIGEIAISYTQPPPPDSPNDLEPFSERIPVAISSNSTASHLTLIKNNKHNNVIQFPSRQSTKEIESFMRFLSEEINPMDQD